MAAGSIPHVALLIETSRSHGRELLMGVRQHIAECEPWSIFMMPRALNSEMPEWLSRWKGDGILTRTTSQTVANAIKKLKIPAVELRSTKLKHDFPFVGVDNKLIGEMIATHFLERGLRNFGLYGVSNETYFEERSNDYIRCVNENGFEVNEFHAREDSEIPKAWEKNQADVAKWLKALPKPVGIMACTDQLGFWLLDACHRAGISVPDDVAVVGVENDDMLCTMSTPPLSSVSFNSKRIGYEAASLLSQMMKGKSVHESTIELPPLGLVTRQSSDVIAVEDGEIGRALRFIRENAHRGIQVMDILKEVPISRTALERRMKSAIGRSPKEEILRNQISQAKDLLLKTELTLSQISHRIGFRHPQYFNTIFKEKVGETPGEYRKQTH